MLHRLRGLFRRRALESEMNAELQGHLDGLTERNIAAGMSPEELNDRIRDREPLVILLLFVVPEAIYTTALIGSLNQTFGKMAVGIKVLDAENRSPIGYPRAFTRWLSTALLWILWVPGILDHLWPLRDSRNQSFHDKFARSVVVRR